MPRLERWIPHGNVLVGYIFDSKLFPPGTRVQTDAIRFVDVSNFEAECLDGKYKLGVPGTAEEHNNELIGKAPDVDVPKMNGLIFLNPNG